MTLPQFITAAKLVIITGRRLSDTEVLETVEFCLEEPFKENDDLCDKLESFRRSYPRWIAKELDELNL